MYFIQTDTTKYESDEQESHGRTREALHTSAYGHNILGTDSSHKLI